MKLLNGAFIPVSATVVLFTICFINPARAEIHLRSTCSRCSIPKHNYGHDTPRFGVTEFAVANAVIGDGPQQRKPFHFRATALKVDHLQLDQIGLAIDKSNKPEGRMIATGRVTHNGGDGGLIGNNVTIRIRAYVAASADTVQIPPDAIVVWKSEHNLWVSRGQKHIDLVPAPAHLSQSEELKGYFEKITHLEVEMDYRRDR